MTSSQETEWVYSGTQHTPRTHTEFYTIFHSGWGVVGSLLIVLLQIFSWLWQWNNFDNRLIFDEVKAYKIRAIFGPPGNYVNIYIWQQVTSFNGNIAWVKILPNVLGDDRGYFFDSPCTCSPWCLMMSFCTFFPVTPTQTVAGDLRRIIEMSVIEITVRLV